MYCSCVVYVLIKNEKEKGTNLYETAGSLKKKKKKKKKKK